MSHIVRTQVVVLGSGPAGYSSAFRCADLGIKTVIIEQYDTLGGVCLNVGCIPSKSLLHIVQVIKESKKLASHGIILSELKINIERIRSWKEKIVSQLTSNLKQMAKDRGIQVINKRGVFADSHTLVATDKNNETVIHFDNAIVAVGSHPIQLPFVPHHDPRVWDSTDALDLKEVPNRMLIIGGGIIGLELGSVYQELGSEIHIVEMLDQVIPNADKDIVHFFTKYISKKLKVILETEISDVEAKEDGIYVTMNRKKTDVDVQRYDVVLVAIGRLPNGKNINIEKAGVKLDERGFIPVNEQLRTNISHIFAIGDVTGQPMLAHKGIREGHIVAEVIAGMERYFDPKVIPSIAYTIPEVGWVGLTEKEAKNSGIDYDTSTFMWTASGRAIASDCSIGLTKLIFNKETKRIIGGSVVGNNGGELLGEISLAIEMGCDSEDISTTIHAHPTLYESIKLAAEIFEGSVTDIPNLKIKKH